MLSPKKHTRRATLACGRPSDRAMSPQPKVTDFLTGKLVNDTPEEYVRQNLEKALVRQYKYAPKDCEPEFTIKVGSSKKRVDIVVFAQGQEHTQANTYILVETKKADVKPTHRTEGIGQLQSYMASCLNSQYGMWTNGDDRFCYAKRSDGKGGWKFDEIIDIPGFGQTEEDAQRPSRKDLKVATADNLLFAFRRCHNYIAAHEGKQKTRAFWELLKLIFTKIEDERSPQINFYATPSERESTGIATAAKKRIQELFTAKVVKKYPTIFDAKDTVIDLKPSVVAYVVTELQGYSLLASPVDVKGGRVRGDCWFQPPRGPRRVLHAAQRVPHGRDHDQPPARRPRARPFLRHRRLPHHCDEPRSRVHRTKRARAVDRSGQRQ